MRDPRATAEGEPPGRQGTLASDVELAERAVDLACPERHPLAKVSKDVAAAAVLVAAVAAVVIGLLILWPPLWCRATG